MKKNNIIKSTLSCLIISSLIVSAVFATTKKGREIVDQLRNDGRPDEEIKVAIEDLGYNAEEYLGKNIGSNINIIKGSNYSESTDGVSDGGSSIIKQLIEKGRTDEEIKIAIENLGYDPYVYFPKITSYSGDSRTTYISRSCKSYNIEYISLMDVYTSPDLQKTEYFINIEYLKRYIDSKNPQKEGCPTNLGWITTHYKDNSSNSDRYIAPNGKVYFITQKNGLYYSSDLNSTKGFSTLSEIKYYIRDRNPLIGMNP